MTAAAIRLTPAPLTAEAFAAYGQALEMPAQAGRQDFAARLVNGRASAQPNFALIRIEPAPLPLTIHTIERHPASTQAFVPLDGGRYLVVVMGQELGGGPDPAHARAFIATEHQAINYDAGTWHVGITALERPTSFCMVIFEDGGPTIATFANWSALSSSRRPEPPLPPGAAARSIGGSRPAPLARGRMSPK